MGDPVQNPGYIPGQPSNYSENNQLNELEKSENRAYAPQLTPSPTPNATSDATTEPEIPQDGNIFNAVSEAYQDQIQQGNLAPEPDSSPDASSTVTDDGNGGSSDSDGGDGDRGGTDGGGNGGGGDGDQ